MAPQVGLEPTTLRLTAECSAIELLRSIAALARVAVNYKQIVTSHEAERQTSASESCGILAIRNLSCKLRGCGACERSASEFPGAAQGE